MKTILAFLLLTSPLFGSDWVLPTSSSEWVLPKAESSWVLPRSRKGVILFTAEWCGPCKVLKEKALPPLRKMGWKIGEKETDAIRIVDIDKHPNIWKKYGSEKNGLPQLVCVFDGEVIRSLRSGCSTPMDEWGIGWLYKGFDERPEPKREPVTANTTHRYPLRGKWWNVAGNYNATKQFVLHHLLTGSKHTRLKSYAPKLKTMSREELQSLHSDDHEKRVDWNALASSVKITSNKSQPRKKALCPT